MAHYTDEAATASPPPPRHPLYGHLDGHIHGRFDLTHPNDGPKYRGIVRKVDLTHDQANVYFAECKVWSQNDGDWMPSALMGFRLVFKESRWWHQEVDGHPALLLTPRNPNGPALTLRRNALMDHLASIAAGHKHRPSRLYMEHMMELLRPLSVQLMMGTFQLAPAEEIDQTKIRHAITMAYGTEVKQIIFVSESQPDPSNWWIDGPVDGSMLTNLEAHMLHLVDTKIYKKMSGPANARCVKENLYDSVSLAIPDSPTHHLKVRNSLRLHLGIALTFATNGHSHRKHAAKFEPLIRLSPQCFPIGPHRDDPTVWFVACR